jgi:hypothetical protein
MDPRAMACIKERRESDARLARVKKSAANAAR